MSLKGKEIEEIVREGHDVLVAGKEKEFYLKFFENTDGDIEYDVYQMKRDENGPQGVFELADGGMIETLEGFEEEYAMESIVPVSSVEVIDTEITNMDEPLLEYEMVNADGTVKEKSYLFVSQDIYDHYMNDADIDEDIALAMMVDYERQYDKEKININKVSATLREIINEVRAEESCTGFFDREFCEEFGLDTLDKYNALRDEVVALGLDEYIEMDDFIRFDDDDELIVVYGSALECFDFSMQEIQGLHCQYHFTVRMEDRNNNYRTVDVLNGLSLEDALEAFEANLDTDYDVILGLNYVDADKDLNKFGVGSMFMMVRNEKGIQLSQDFLQSDVLKDDEGVKQAYHKCELLKEVLDDEMDKHESLDEKILVAKGRGQNPEEQSHKTEKER